MPYLLRVETRRGQFALALEDIEHVRVKLAEFDGSGYRLRVIDDKGCEIAPSIIQMIPDDQSRHIDRSAT